MLADSNPGPRLTADPSTPSSKVPIPRASQFRSPGNGRVRKACIDCRKHKTKCNGHHPCSRCASLGITCVYADGRREIIDSRLEKLEKQVQAYDRLLKEFQPRLDNQDRDLIAETPAQDKGLQAIGFIGAPAEISWIRDLHHILENDLPFLDREQSNKSQSLKSACYFLDNEDLVLDPSIDPYGRPPHKIADKLLDCYFFAVHPSFPIIAKIPFMHQYEIYYTQSEPQSTRLWLTILNLVFALAAIFAQLASKPWVCEADTPMTSFTRAWNLSFNENYVLEHPNLQRVQVDGLMAFVLMSLGHVNRSWRACGVAVRSAIALGINMRSKSEATSNIKGVPNTLSKMTGRPTSAPDRFSTAPLPIPFDEEQLREPVASRLLADFNARSRYMQALVFQQRARSAADDSPVLDHQSSLPVQSVVTPGYSLYFLYFVDLAMIMRRAIDSLYSPGSARRSWRATCAAIMDLIQETDEWLSRVPPVFQFKVRHPSTDFERQKYGLAFLFYSLRITVGRLSLCCSERQYSRNKASVPGHRNFATICIDSVSELLDLLPDKPDAVWLVQVSPWWCIAHYLTEAVAILLTEMEFCIPCHVDRASRIRPRLEKGLDWLYSLGSINVTVRRAWGVSNNAYNHLVISEGIRRVSSAGSCSV
ncbi:hypothetical protein ASPSYDRAFT_63100 [Aspergillus sydowii CBS 593.65]|uniref:Zn(2)-C6 fungal-type domain-containing protein n=1 Tax=Aspergillus sydowii CBS 593.65 TaxID=1036612 RepID=A0A1L9SXJ4_9EURO|nr:uncharacterized protein ASPSYDRAFT_63100 [Aspergillus sydowii CBS 593.65]OJJ51879.1 hypothetical protein ASPSYDRAFT_63100 [Aspergillus sydowii CBS 593.65]